MKIFANHQEVIDQYSHMSSKAQTTVNGPTKVKSAAENSIRYYNFTGWHRNNQTINFLSFSYRSKLKLKFVFLNIICTTCTVERRDLSGQNLKNSIYRSFKYSEICRCHSEFIQSPTNLILLHFI